MVGALAGVSVGGVRVLAQFLWSKAVEDSAVVGGAAKGGAQGDCGVGLLAADLSDRRNALLFLVFGFSV